MGENKFWKFIFSDDIRKYLILFVIIGAFLRYLIVEHVVVLADEMLHGPHAINIIKSGVINLQNQSPAWFYLTDVLYRIFGVVALSSRGVSFFYGIFTIVLVYLIAEKLYNKKIALISSFLYAISAYAIRYSLMEMDIGMMFFILLGFYFFIKDEKKLSLLTPVCLGIALLMKPIALPFIAGYVLYAFFIFKNKGEGKIYLKENWKRIVAGIGIILLFTMPVLAYNYILYKEKGITDVIFSRFLKINPSIYSSLQGFDKSFEFSYMINPGIKKVFWEMFMHLDPAISILALVGIILLFTKEYSKGRFFALMQLPVFLFLMGTSLLETHFVSFMALFSIMAAIAVNYLVETFGKTNKNRLMFIILGLVIIVNLVVLLPSLTSGSAVLKMRDYAIDNFNKNDIVVADGRIYTGRVVWMLNDKNFLYANYLTQLLQINQNLSGEDIPTTVYFIECAVDDCGWGTIKDQPDYNASMEELVQAFRQNSEQVKVFYGGGGASEEPTGKPYFILYKTVIPLKAAVYPLIQDTHEWFYYPVGWSKDDWYDKYTPNGLFQNLLQGAGKGMLWVAVLLALLAPLYVIYEAYKKN